MEKVQVLPYEVQAVIRGILEILDSEYGANRDKYADDGGYAVVAESIEDFREIQKRSNIYVNNVIVEYVDKILCTDGQVCKILISHWSLAPLKHFTTKKAL